MKGSIHPLTSMGFSAHFHIWCFGQAGGEVLVHNSHPGTHRNHSQSSVSVHGEHGLGGPAGWRDSVRALAPLWYFKYVQW